MYIHIHRGEGGHTGAQAVRPWAWSEGQGCALRGACAEGPLGEPDLPEMQSTAENFIFIYL